MALHNSTLYVTSTEGLIVFDVQQPASPQKLATYSNFGSTDQITISGDQAYIASYFLMVLDVSDPARLLEVGQFSFGDSISALAIDSGYAYVATGQNGLRVLDVRQPAQISEIPIVYAPGSIWEMQLHGARAYVAGGKQGLFVFDLSNAAQPQPLFHLMRDWTIYNVVVREDRLYVAAYTQTFSQYYIAVRIFDISGAAEPQFLADYVSTVGITDFTVVDKRLYVASRSDGIEIVDLSTPTSPVRLGGRKYIDSEHVLEARRVQVEGDRIYVGTDPFVYVLDATQPTNPEIIDRTGGARSFQVVGTIEYFVAGSYLFIDDVQSRDHPRPVGYLLLPQPIDEAVLQVAGKRVYIGTVGKDNNYVYAVDVSDLANPKMLARSDTQPVAADIEVTDSHLYAASYNFGLFVYGQKELPATPTSTPQSTPTPSATAMPAVPPSQTYTQHIPVAGMRR